jgi:lipopolysaccharide transport system permease protein
VSSAAEIILPEKTVPSVPPVAPVAPTVAAPTLPVDDLPVTQIVRHTGWQLVDLRELWRYRELLYLLTWRDLKVRYKQTVLGAAWALLQPLANTLVFCLFLGRVVEVAKGIEHYPLFVFSAALPWTFFANAVTGAGSSVVGSQNLITKIYFPRLIIPMATVAAGLVDFAIGLILLFVLMLVYGVTPTWSILFAPLMVLMLIVAALGVGTLLAALTVAYRDFRYVVPFTVQLWMLATPIIYFNKDIIGPLGQTWLPLNPAYGLIYNFRLTMIDHHPFDWYAFSVSSAVSVALLLIGCLYFRRVERTFADII